ncbi:hypothetical protein IFM89_016528 [Coptis chinensis]|uniref:Uncharacterized protein n=1 Tax=Coptis chinensis TaxID=261450 RepID=A0A835IPF9_9MAGN|nr:hypothetical protein IFM89_016528 [Coptis chinensis]
MDELLLSIRVLADESSKISSVKEEFTIYFTSSCHQTTGKITAPESVAPINGMVTSYLIPPSPNFSSFLMRIHTSGGGLGFFDILVNGLVTYLLDRQEALFLSTVIENEDTYRWA